ncbi:type VI secretion system Vgr family protein [Burkholderia sp. WSM2232]|uniref:type VI secretion system Vgr family protein n=1 Tax=Burkholderia sp. WSM2232 TaxID=944436 RepID=UPI000412103C|nr:type VI secretion system tip protein TssI/VgrG [Burkholderia sp. WSM2232]
MAESDRIAPLFTLACEGLSEDAFFVVRWTAEEAVSRPYRVELTLATAQTDLDPARLLGARARFSIKPENGAARRFHGVLREVEQFDADAQYVYYRAVLMPRFAGLADFRFSEVYLNATLPDIVRAVMRACGLGTEGGDGAGSYDFSVSVNGANSEATRTEFVCQFEEDCLAFLSRRLEHEGIYYYFTQLEDQEAVVFCDALAAQPSASTALTYGTVSTRDQQREVASVERFSCQLAVAPRSVTLRDFAGSHAALRLSVDEQVEGGRHGEVSVYGEHFGTEREGRRLARLRAQALACDAKRFHGMSKVPDVAAGYFFDLSRHRVSAFNARYYVIEVRHEGAQPMPGGGTDSAGGRVADLIEDYRNEFVALPAEVQFRPKPGTSRRAVAGVISAVIDAEGEGPYAQINEHGCYKVRFPFGRSNKPEMRMSAWVRLASPYAGANHGMHFPLLKGTEVLVAFLNGDPDRPVIVGAVSNSENPNIVTDSNAAQNAIRTAGGNVLTLDDSSGKQSIELASPVAKTSIKLGAAGAPGLALTSDNHMQIDANSYTRSIGGVYKETISASAAGGNTSDPSGLDAFIKGSWSSGKDNWFQPSTGAGVIMANYFGVAIKTYMTSSTNLYIGNSNTISLGNSNSIKMGLAFEFNLSASVQVAKAVQKRYVLTAKQRFIVNQDDLVKDSKLQFLARSAEGTSDTARVATKRTDAGSYAINAGVYELRAGLPEGEGMATLTMMGAAGAAEAKLAAGEVEMTMAAAGTLLIEAPVSVYIDSPDMTLTGTFIALG